MKTTSAIAAVLLALLAPDARASIYDEERPVLETKAGKLQGVVEHGMVAFKNIPYAAPPVGDLRWRPPQPAKAWVGVRDASRFGEACIQPLVKGYNSELVPGSEDCLQLNVYAPPGAKDAPVMVWIHGGALLFGSAVEPYYQPFALTKAGAVVVTVNYRLGKLGFFAPRELAEEAAANHEPVGNYGVMDQIAALRWVKENIRTFGGDPGNVTIFGQSAGGRSVLWLMTSPAAKGLFHRAISESAQQLPLRDQKKEKGSIPSEEAMDARFLAAIGAKDLKEARSLPADRILVTPEEFQEGDFSGSFIDGEIIAGDPIPLFAQGKQAAVPFIIGTNSWDASFFMIGQPSLDAYLDRMHEDPKVVEKLYAKYPYRCVLTAEVMADGWYRGGVKMLADSAAKLAPSYAYYFSYLTPGIRASHPGAAHTFELPYVFGTMALVLPAPRKAESGVDPCALIGKVAIDLKQKNELSAYLFPTTDANGKEDRAISEQIASAWVAFARTGNPNVAGQVHWPTYRLRDDVMRNFGGDREALVRDLYKDRVEYQMRALNALYGVR